MRFTFRPTKPTDFSASISLIADGFVHDDAARSTLPGFWNEVLTRRLGRSAVIEDQERPLAERAVGFGLSAFITDEFAQEVKIRSRPYISQQVLERWLQGRAPLLTLEDTCCANSGDGLNVLVLHYGIKQGMSAEQYGVVGQLLIEAFTAGHRGYQLKELLEEVYGVSDLQSVLRAGSVLRTDYGSFFRRSRLPRPLPDRHPYLIGLTRKEALMQGPGTYARTLFLFTPSRFHFTLAEQDLLEHALQGETDEEMSCALKIALITVKKRWVTIYDRVATVEPQLFIYAPVREGRRGVEKRRRLLTYLREHPEELRPGSLG